MSTIAYRDGIIAADTLCVRGDMRAFHRTKMGRRADGTLGGAGGNLSFCAAFIEWVESGDGDAPERHQDKHSSDVGFIVYPDGRIRIFEHGGDSFVQAPYIAIGSGCPFALAAMYLEQTAFAAVAVAIHFDIYSGGNIEMYHQDNPTMAVIDVNKITNAD